jgi:hypothetical protein
VNKANSNTLAALSEGAHAVQKKNPPINNTDGTNLKPCDIKDRMEFVVFRTMDPKLAYWVEFQAIKQYGPNFTCMNVKHFQDNGPPPTSDVYHYVCITCIPSLLPSVVTGKCKFNEEAYVQNGNGNGNTKLVFYHKPPDQTVEAIVQYVGDQVLIPQFKIMAKQIEGFDVNTQAGKMNLQRCKTEVQTILTRAGPNSYVPPATYIQQPLATVPRQAVPSPRSVIAQPLLHQVCYDSFGCCHVFFRIIASRFYFQTLAAYGGGRAFW